MNCTVIMIIIDLGSIRKEITVRHPLIKHHKSIIMTKPGINIKRYYIILIVLYKQGKMPF